MPLIFAWQATPIFYSNCYGVLLCGSLKSEFYFFSNVDAFAINGLYFFKKIRTDCAPHPVEISKWQKWSLDGVDVLITRGGKNKELKSQAIETELFQQCDTHQVDFSGLNEILSCSNEG